MKIARTLLHLFSAEQWTSRWLKYLGRRSARYLVVGVIGAVTEFLLFVGLTRAGGGIVLSNIVAFHCAFVLCYFLHYHYTHERPFEGLRSVASGFMKYAALVYILFILGSVLLWFFTGRLMWSPELSKIMQMAIVTPIGYFVQKGLIFQKRNPN